MAEGLDRDWKRGLPLDLTVFDSKVNLAGQKGMADIDICRKITDKRIKSGFRPLGAAGLYLIDKQISTP